MYYLDDDIQPDLGVKIKTNTVFDENVFIVRTLSRPFYFAKLMRATAADHSECLPPGRWLTEP